MGNETLKHLSTNEEAKVIDTSSVLEKMESSAVRAKMANDLDWALKLKSMDAAKKAELKKWFWDAIKEKLARIDKAAFQEKVKTMSNSRDWDSKALFKDKPDELALFQLISSYQDVDWDGWIVSVKEFFEKGLDKTLTDYDENIALETDKDWNVVVKSKENTLDLNIWGNNTETENTAWIHIPWESEKSTVLPNITEKWKDVESLLPPTTVDWAKEWVLKAKINAWEANEEITDADLEALEGQLKTAKENLETETNSLNTMKADLETKRTTANTLEAEADTLQGEMELHKAELSNEKVKEEPSQELIEQLTTSINEKEKKCIQWYNDAAKERNGVKSIKENIALQDKKVTEAKAVVDDLQSKVTNITGEVVDETEVVVDETEVVVDETEVVVDETEVVVDETEVVVDETDEATLEDKISDIDKEIEDKTKLANTLVITPEEKIKLEEEIKWLEEQKNELKGQRKEKIEKTEEEVAVVQSTTKTAEATEQNNLTAETKSDLWKMLEAKPSIEDDIDFEAEMESEAFREEFGDFTLTVWKDFKNLIDDNQEWLKDALSSTSMMTIDWEKLYVENNDWSYEITETGETVRSVMEQWTSIIADATVKMVDDLKEKKYDNSKVLDSFNTVWTEMKKISTAFSNKSDVALFFAENSWKEIDENSYSNQEAKWQLNEWASNVTHYHWESQEMFKNENSLINNLTSWVKTADDIKWLYDKTKDSFSRYVLDWEVIYTADPLSDEYLNWEEINNDKTEIVKEQLQNWIVKWFSLSKLLTKVLKESDNINSLHPNVLEYWTEWEHEALFKHMAWETSTMFNDDEIWDSMKSAKKWFKKISYDSEEKLEKKMKNDMKEETWKWRLNGKQIAELNKEVEAVQNTEQFVEVKNWVYDTSRLSDTYDLSFYKLVRENASWEKENVYVHKDNAQDFLSSVIEEPSWVISSAETEDFRLKINERELAFQKLWLDTDTLKNEWITYYQMKWKSYFNLPEWNQVVVSIEDDKVTYDYNFRSENVSWTFKDSLTWEWVNHTQTIANLSDLWMQVNELADKYNKRRTKNKEEISDQIADITSNIQTLAIWDRTAPIDNADDKEYLSENFDKGPISIA